jgi:hypothetical protein
MGGGVIELKGGEREIFFYYLQFIEDSGQGTMLPGFIELLLLFPVIIYLCTYCTFVL